MTILWAIGSIEDPDRSCQEIKQPPGYPALHRDLLESCEKQRGGPGERWHAPTPLQEGMDNGNNVPSGEGVRSSGGAPYSSTESGVAPYTLLSYVAHREGLYLGVRRLLRSVVWGGFQVDVSRSSRRSALLSRPRRGSPLILCMISKTAPLVMSTTPITATAACFRMIGTATIGTPA